MPVSVSCSCRVRGDGGAPLGFRPPQAFGPGSLFCCSASGGFPVGCRVIFLSMEEVVP